MNKAEFLQSPYAADENLLAAAQAAHRAWCEWNATHLDFDRLDTNSRLMWMYIALKARENSPNDLTRAKQSR